MLTHAQVWSAIDRLAARAWAFGLGPCPTRRARPHDLQQIQAHHSIRLRALAVDRIDQQGVGGDRHQHRCFCGIDPGRQSGRADPAAFRCVHVAEAAQGAGVEGVRRKAWKSMSSTSRRPDRWIRESISVVTAPLRHTTAPRKCAHAGSGPASPFHGGRVVAGAVARAALPSPVARRHPGRRAAPKNPSTCSSSRRPATPP